MSSSMILEKEFFKTKFYFLTFLQISSLNVQNAFVCTDDEKISSARQQKQINKFNTFKF